jgi:signal transduction histidine kinase
MARLPRAKTLESKIMALVESEIKAMLKEEVTELRRLQAQLHHQDEIITDLKLRIEDLEGRLSRIRGAA